MHIGKCHHLCGIATNLRGQDFHRVIGLQGIYISNLLSSDPCSLHISMPELIVQSLEVVLKRTCRAVTFSHLQAIMEWFLQKRFSQTQGEQQQQAVMGRRMSCRVYKPQDASRSFPHSINKNLQNASIVNLTTCFCFCNKPVTNGVPGSDFVCYHSMRKGYQSPCSHSGFTPA